MEFSKPYKITLWEDETSYLVQRGSKKVIVSELKTSDVVLNTWNSEKCIATIGSNTMDTPIRAYDPKFKQEINGKKTLTFSIAFRYWDYEDEEFKQNPFINLLVNERRVKLLYNDEWHEFVIKEKEENSEKYIFNYTCEDIYLTELGRNGYEVELNTKLENNSGTAIELGTKILAESDWEIAPIGTGENDSDAIIQTTKEGLYIFQIKEQIRAECLVDFEYNNINVSQGTPKIIPKNSTIFIFYSTVINQENPIQFFYVDENDEYRYAENNYYAIDDHGFIINSPNWSFKPNSLSEFYGIPQDQSLDDFQLNMSSYFGEKVFRMQESTYLPSIDKQCASYVKNGSKYYCYKESEYASIDAIQNLLVNTEAFLDTNGWGSYDDSINVYLPVSGELNGQMTLQMNLTPGWVMYDSFDDAVAAHAAGKRVYYKDEELYKLVRPTESLVLGETYYKNETCYNTGFFHNRNLLRELVVDNKDAFVLMLQMDSPDDQDLSEVGAEVYARKVAEEGMAEDLLVQFSGPGIVDENGYLTLFGKIKKGISYTTLLDTYTDIVFYLYGNGTYSISKALCFKKVLDAKGKIIIPDLQTTANAITRDKYYFFRANQINDKITSTDDLVYDAIQYDESDFTPYYPSTMEKVTMIEGEKSNYFNLIQTICEKFECWAKFIIEHDKNGAILNYYVLTEDSERKEGKTYYIPSSDNELREEDYYDHTKWVINKFASISNLYERKASKKIAFKEYIGRDNLVGFRYGINLKSIIRNVKSDEITTKLIVEKNSNEFAKDGACSIQKASLNTSGENMIFNFQYFINHKLIDETELNKDLYGSIDKTGIALIPNLHKINKEVQKLIKEKPGLISTLDNINNSLLILENQSSEAEEAMTKLVQDIEATGYADLTPELLEKFEYLRNLMTQRQHNSAILTTYEDIIKNLNELNTEYQKKYDNLIKALDSYTIKKNMLTKEFYKKYSKYIREGTWISEDYYDEDLYYLDAQMVLYTSAFPQINYTINVIEISEIEGFEPYTFKNGDKTYMEDTEFFGWDSKGRPYKEEIVISEVLYHLDDPSQNTIKVQNYKTQFEDLFQRIAAQTQSLQYSEGEYRRAANAISQDYIIDGTLMQNSLKNNSLIIQNARNQSVTWDDTGISISNVRKPNEIVRMTSNGIVLTRDGGQTWETGISASGINADVITAGRLDTNMIRIFNGERQTFQWNSTGINAYRQDAATQAVDYNAFVRFDQYGLYGLIKDADWSPDTPDKDGDIGLAKIKKDAYFSLTWDGLKIKIDKEGTEEKVEVINVNDNFIVYNDGSIIANNGTFSGTLSAAKVSGALTSSGDGWLEGLGIRVGEYTDPTDGETKYRFFVDNDGNVTLSGDINWNSDATLTKTLYNRDISNIAEVPAGISYEDFPSTYTSDVAGGWHTTLSSSDFYISYSYDGGKTWNTKMCLVPDYIGKTEITSTTIKSPTIIGGLIRATESSKKYVQMNGSAFELWDKTIFTNSRAGYITSFTENDGAFQGLLIGSGRSLQFSAPESMVFEGGPGKFNNSVTFYGDVEFVGDTYGVKARFG